MSVMLLVHRRCKWEGTLNNMRRNAGARDDLEASTHSLYLIQQCHDADWSLRSFGTHSPCLVAPDNQYMYGSY